MMAARIILWAERVYDTPHELARSWEDLDREPKHRNGEASTSA
jgi:hypothetical protein